MLVLSRRVQERIRLTTPGGEVIWITLCEVERGRARIGISAPGSVEIKREELIPASRSTPVSGSARSDVASVPTGPPDDLSC